MRLWLKWFEIVKQMRGACSRRRTFMWLTVALMGFTVRTENLGVTSIVRALGLKSYNYDRLLDFFHSAALSIEKLTNKWTSIVIQNFPLIKKNGRIILVADGLKVAKSGKKMPSIKKMHQESESNTKPEFILGHSFQSIGVLAKNLSTVFAVPLISRIHEGLQFSNRDKRTLQNKLIEELFVIFTTTPFYLVADAYYSCRTMIHGIIESGNHIISRMRINSVAYEEAIIDNEKKNRGRPKKYGNKILLVDYFKNMEIFIIAKSPIADEKKVFIKYLEKVLYWKRAGVKIKFVLVMHPQRGKIILMSTDLTQSALEIIELYSLRWKIEVSFKQAVREVGAYSYHFWMKKMISTTREGKKQYMHKKTEEYRKEIRRKMDAYHRFVQIGIIAQGLLQYLSLCHTQLVWKSFGSWLRTIRPNVLPSEMVTSIAMRNTLPEFLVARTPEATVTKFIRERIDVERSEGAKLVA